MIYSSNRVASLGNLTIDVNRSYFGAGALSFTQESAQDELVIFESAVKSDMEELFMCESSYDLQVLNEGFVDNVMDKIRSMMKKLMEWLEAVARSALAKLSQLLVRDNSKFCKLARKQIMNMKNQSKFEATGKIIKKFSQDNIVDLVANFLERNNDVSLSDVIKSIVEENATITLDVVKYHIDILEKLSSKDIKKLRDKMKKHKEEAAKVVKTAKSKLDKIKDDDAAREQAQKELDEAKEVKNAVQKSVSLTMQAIKKISSIARAVVAKAMGATPKSDDTKSTNEAVWEDEDLANAMLESMDLEYDDALEEMSEAKCESDDEDDDEDSEEDED